jgi:hypothetical protein
MNTFRVKPEHLLGEKDFIEHPVWATYYEPDDIETLESLGFDAGQVQAALEPLNLSDDYSFPLPVEAAGSPFHYLFLSVRAQTKGGNQLVGYITGACLAVFFQGNCYHFNPNLQARSLDNAFALAAALNESMVFPMKVEIVATSKTMECDL